MKETKGKGARAGRKTTVKTPHQNDEARSEAGKAGKPQTTTAKRAAGKPAVTSGSRPMQKRASRSPTPQTKRAMTPKETIHHIYLQTKVAQTDVTRVFRAAFELASEQLIKWGMFTLPEVGVRLVRQPLPATGRAAGFPATGQAAGFDGKAGETREGEAGFALRGIPLKRLLDSTNARRID